MSIWKSLCELQSEELFWRKIIAVKYTTYAVAKTKPEKIQACMGFEPLTSAILVQRSTN